MGGGGIENGGTLTLSNSTVSGNTARGFGDSFGGGGINNFGTAIIRNSTVSGNGGPFGGGISNAFGTLTLINSTLFGNYAAYSGGGIANAGTLTVSNSTLSENYSVCDGGAISTPISFSLCIPGIGNSAPTTLKNTIVANSRSGGNCQGTFISAGHNVSDDASCSFSGPGDLNSTPAGLDPGGLKDNGGPTHTIALLPTSPAVHGVPLSSCTAVDGTPIATDQRGIPRPQGLACDIGAYEYLAITAPAPTSGTTCNGAYNGTFSGNITVSAGQNCIFFNGGVTGDVQQYGGSFVLFQSKVGGDVQVKGGGTFSIGPSSTINGNLQIQNLPGGSGQNQVCGTTVGGDLQFQNSGTAVLIGGHPPSPCSGNTVGGNLQVQNNWASTSVVGNTVSGNLMDQNNTGPTQVFNNTVSGNLHCQNDTTIQGGGNVVTNQKQGQCAGF
jgi:hypothetical protein